MPRLRNPRLRTSPPISGLYERLWLQYYTKSKHRLFGKIRFTLSHGDIDKGTKELRSLRARSLSKALHWSTLSLRKRVATPICLSRRCITYWNSWSLECWDVCTLSTLIRHIAGRLERRIGTQFTMQREEMREEPAIITLLFLIVSMA